jgi:hypothetical protein
MRNDVRLETIVTFKSLILKKHLKNKLISVNRTLYIKMGQEWSWPCASRETQEKKINESKYDFGFLEQQTGEPTEDPRNSAKMQKIAKIEKIITNREYNSRMSTTPSPSVAGTPYSFTDDSLNEDEMNVIVVCEEIDDFDGFMAKYTKKYKNVD